jgi:hypothetical protein
LNPGFGDAESTGQASDGEPIGQATAVVRTARRASRAREPGLGAPGQLDLDARLRRRTAGVTEQPPTPANEERAAEHPPADAAKTKSAPLPVRDSPPLSELQAAPEPRRSVSAAPATAGARRSRLVSCSPSPPDSSLRLASADGHITEQAVADRSTPDTQSLILRFNRAEHEGVLEV